MIEVTIYTRLMDEYVVDYLGELYYLLAGDIIFHEGKWYTYPNKLSRRYHKQGK